jgi:predicted Na+-dependent transporter
MPLYEAPAFALAWLGRQGTRAIAALVVIGLVLPPLDALLKPFVTEAIFVLLCISFLRINMAALRHYIQRPTIILAATIWTIVLVPALFGLISTIFGLDARAPDLVLGLMLQASTSPMMASPALAALMGLDATLVLVTMVASTALVPVTAPLLTYAFVGPVLTLSPLALGLKLLAILAGSAFVGLTLRYFAGPMRIERYKLEIDGINILALFVFVAAVMENVAGQILSMPLATTALAALAFCVFFLLFGMSALVFAWAGRERALALGFMVSQRNMGLMMAVMGGALPDLTWLYFALSQFPIYLAPQMLKPLVQRLQHKAWSKSGTTG